MNLDCFGSFAKFGLIVLLNHCVGDAEVVVEWRVFAAVSIAVALSGPVAGPSMCVFHPSHWVDWMIVVVDYLALGSGSGCRVPCMVRIEPVGLGLRSIGVGCLVLAGIADYSMSY